MSAAVYAPPPPFSSPTLSSAPAYPPYQQPPQLAYGWWVDVLPPRGPYLWPCLPESYSIAQPVQLKAELGQGGGAAVSQSHHSFLSQPPQMCYGWFVHSPPASPPYFWSCLPPGYTLVQLGQAAAAAAAGGAAAAQQQQQQPEQRQAAGSSNRQQAAAGLTTTTRQGNVTLTLPSLPLSPPPSSSEAAAAAASSSLHPASSSLSLSGYWPPSKAGSLSGSLLQSPSQSESLGFLNLSQQDDQQQQQQSGQQPPAAVPLPVRSPALEGLANVAVPSEGGFSLDGTAAAAGDAAAGDDAAAAADDEDAGRKGKRRRGGKR